jgi:WD40 repeat protein/DNA-binding SARP family transcriptional activator
MSQLAVYLLGLPRIELNGVPLQIERRKALALLIYLAVSPQPHSRDSLATLFWPGYDQTYARANLRRTLSALNQALGKNWLEVERESVAFPRRNPSTLPPSRVAGQSLWVDVTQFRHLLASCAAHGHPPGEVCPACLNPLSEAVALYHDDFLTGFTLPDSPDFDDWQLFQAEALRQELAEALERLVQGHAAQEVYKPALAYARRWLALNPLHEPAHRRLMQLYVQAGDTAAALRQYQECVRVLKQDLDVSPSVETTILFERIRQGTEEPRSGGAEEISPLPRRDDGLTLPSRGSLTPAHHFPSAQDWGETPDIGVFYGRQAELAELKRWLIADRCRLGVVLGMGGVGKTALAAKLTHELADQFEGVIWRSLLNAPPLAEILRVWLQFLSAQQLTDPPASLDERLALLFDFLRQRRCLLVLDNVEGILQGGDRAGSYRPGYEEYGQLIQRLGEAKHQSCLLLTSRERPREFARLEGDTALVRSLQLAGLNAEAGQEILKARGLIGPAEAGAILVERYSGNPLALKLVAETIHELFEGDITAFLTEETLVFDDIRDVLDQQFARLSALEREIMVWLAIEREAISAQTLWDNLVSPESRRAFLEALRSLQRRSLLEKSGDGFTLQNVVTEYTTDHLIAQVCQEIETGVLALFMSHALLKAQTKEYVRESQIRLILQLTAERLIARLGRAGLETKLRGLLAILRAEAPLAPGYAGGNILNLLLYLGCDVRGYDFSRLTVWQAYLRGAALPEVNFTGADLARSVFTDVFGFVNSVTFSPDGRLLAVGTEEGEIRLWQVATGQPAGICRGHANAIRSVAFSPDGRLLVSGSKDQTVRLWDVRTGQCLNTLRGHTDWVRSVAFSPTGEILASGSDDQTVRLWDARTGQCLNTLPGHTNWVNSVTFSPTGEILASGGADRTVRLWDAHTGQALHTLHGHTDWVNSVAFSPTGESLASGSADRTVRLWDVNAGQCLNTLHGHTNWVNSVAFSSTGETLASGGADQTVRLWDVNAGQCLNTLHGHTNRVNSVAFSPSGEVLASGSDDQTVRLWDAHTGQALHTLHGHTDWVNSVAFSPTGEILASGGADRTVRLWDAHTGQALHTLHGHTDGVGPVAFSPTGETLASGSADQTVRLWNAHTGQALHTLHGHTHWVRSVAFSPNGEILASGSGDQTVRLWDAHTGQALHTLHGHTHWVNSVAFSPNGEILASGSTDQTVRLWDAHTGQALHTLHGHTRWIKPVAFSPTGEILASGSGDQTVRLWDLRRTGQCLNTLHGHTDWVNSVAFSPTGEVLASGGADRTVRLWDVNAGQAFHILRGHTHWVNSVAFSPNGEILASSADETVKVWDVRTGECLQTLRADGPYARMNITGATGLTETQRTALKALGAVENMV